MGLLRAAFDAMSGTLGDQWLDFFTIPAELKPTAALFAAVRRGQNVGRGSNIAGSSRVISNGSKILVPEGYGLVLLQDGAITGFASEPGGYEWNSEAPDSSSVFHSDGIFQSLISASLERFKFGGRPGSEQDAYFISLKELPNNRFGTIADIYWDDAFLGTQAGATVRGTYTLRIVDPIRFIKQFVPASYLRSDKIFDFTDIANDAATQLYNEVVASLSPAFANYANAGDKANRISNIQRDSLGFGKTLAAIVEDSFAWREQRGLEIVSSAIASIEYDEATKELLRTVQRADSLLGARGNSNLQASMAAGVQAAGEGEGAAGLMGLGIVGGSLGLSGLQQPVAGSSGAPAGSPQNLDPMSELKKYKEMLDAGLISEADYDTVKRKILGI